MINPKDLRVDVISHHTGNKIRFIHKPTGCFVETDKITTVPDVRTRLLAALEPLVNEYREARFDDGQL